MFTRHYQGTFTRRHFLAGGGGLLALATALAACSSRASSAPTPVPASIASAKSSATSTPVKAAAAAPTAAPKAVANPVTGAFKGEVSVEWWGGEPKPGSFDEWSFIAQNYKKVRPDINLKVIRIPWSSVAQWVQTQLAANTLPDLLIWYLMPTTQQEATHTSPWLAFDDYLKDRSTYTKKPWIEDIDVGLAKIYFGALRFQ